MFYYRKETDDLYFIKKSNPPVEDLYRPGEDLFIIVSVFPQKKYLDGKVVWKKVIESQFNIADIDCIPTDLMLRFV